MSHDAIREVLRSPLDDLPRSGRGWGGVVLAFLVAAAAGVGATAGAKALADGGGDMTSTTTTIIEATTAVPGPIPMGEVGAEVAWAWQQGGRLYLLVATTVRPGADPADVESVPSAHWVLRLPDGDLLTATGEHTSQFAPGLFTVEFPATDFSGPAELLAYPAAESTEARFPTTRSSAQLPWEGPLDGAPYHLDDEEIIIDGFLLDDAGGEITWHLAGGSASRAVVSAGAGYAEVGGDPQVIVPEEELPLSWLVSTRSATPSARSGLIHLYRLDDPAQPTFRSRFWGEPDRVVPVQGLRMEIRVQLYRYAEDPAVVPFELPAAG